MTVEEVRRRVAEVQGLATEHAHEDAHIQEKGLFKDVLAAIASGEPNAKDLAAAALKTLDIDFQRWYA